jgi:hypothetical protein
MCEARDGFAGAAKVSERSVRRAMAVDLLMTCIFFVC